MKRLRNGRSSSKTRPAHLTEHSYELKDEEITTQKVKFTSLYEQNEAVAEEDDEAGYTLKLSSIKNGVINQQNQQQQHEKKFICSQCGKGFQSLKAKCGHMACHSTKEKAPITMDETQSDTESEAPKLTRRSSRVKYKKHNSVSVVSLHTNCSSEDSETEQEQADVAISLMLLSRDSGNWIGLNSVGDSSDNNSVVLEARSISTKLARKGSLTSNVHRVEPWEKPASKKMTFLGDSESLKLRDIYEGSKMEPHLSLKKLERAFDDKGCNQSKNLKKDLLSAFNPNAENCKNFKPASPYESVENSFETDASLIRKENVSNLRDFIDLNLPAPMEDDEASEFITCYG